MIDRVEDIVADSDDCNSESAPAEAEPQPVGETTAASSAAPEEIGGRDGPDPTRYGDWEKAGRCIDF